MNIYKNRGIVWKSSFFWDQLTAPHYFPLFIILVICGLFPLPLLKARDSGNSPDHVVVVANLREAQSVDLARYYMHKRNIPDANLILLNVSPQEAINWEDFIEEIYNPLAKVLVEKEWIDGILSDLKDSLGRYRYSVIGHKIDYLVVCRGIPLKIPHSDKYAKMAPVSRVNSQVGTMQASVDGELALIAYPENNPFGFVRNPLFKPNAKQQEIYSTVRVARLDGPSYSVARGLVDLAIEGEEKGLKGRAYIDMGYAYKQGENWLENIANSIDDLGFDLEVERTANLFEKENRFDAPVLYFGWYKNDIYGAFNNPGFRFPPGAVAVHIHSFSAATVVDAQKTWCGPFLSRGVTATLGNVNEPYLPYSHYLDVFFEVLKNGGSLGDAGYQSLPYLGWQAVLFGDPLYRPFGKTLDQQLAEIQSLPSFSLYDQYTVIRKMRILVKGNRMEDAFSFGLSMLHKAPGLALIHYIGFLSVFLGKEEQVLDDLESVRHLTYLGPGDWVPAMELAELLHRKGRTQAALETHGNLIKSVGLPKALLRKALESGIKESSMIGNLSQSIQWQSQLDELN